MPLCKLPLALLQNLMQSELPGGLQSWTTHARICTRPIPLAVDTLVLVPLHTYDNRGGVTPCQRATLTTAGTNYKGVSGPGVWLTNLARLWPRGPLTGTQGNLFLSQIPSNIESAGRSRKEECTSSIGVAFCIRLPLPFITTRSPGSPSPFSLQPWSFQSGDPKSVLSCTPSEGLFRRFPARPPDAPKL